MVLPILDERRAQVITTRAGDAPADIACGKHSLAGSVSQRACVFCGSRVVLYPIADAIHLVHGPIGCAAYTWDIRGALSSGPQLHRNSFCTDLQEKDVIYGGADKLYRSLIELIDLHHPKAAFIYSTCIVGLMGDDVQAICRRVEREKGIPVISVDSEGFKGTKKDGYKAACHAIFKLMNGDEATKPRSDVGQSESPSSPFVAPSLRRSVASSINILGDFNIAGEVWMIKEYFSRMGVEVISCITGDGRVDEIRRAPQAALNVVQCSGSMTHLAQMMEQKYGIPYFRVSYFGIEDMSASLYKIAQHFNDPGILHRTQELVREEIAAVYPALRSIRKELEGKRAAVYVGGAFKCFSLVKALRLLGMKTVLVGSQTGNKADYEELQNLCDPGTVIVDDTNPVELAQFMLEKDVDLLIGGVKERPIAYKMGVGFCDHNHERKIPLAGFAGMLNFATEVRSTVMSPVWKLVPRRSARER